MIANMTLIEKAIIIKMLAENNNLIIVDAGSKTVFTSIDIIDVQKQGDKIHIVVKK